MKIEFTLKDRNGVELNEGDRVCWHCDNTGPVQFGNIIVDMYNGGEIIPGKLMFYKTKESVKSMYQETTAYKESEYSYCPSNSATLELMFVSDNGDPIWAIDCPSENTDFKHPKLEKII